LQSGWKCHGRDAPFGTRSCIECKNVHIDA
jgi:hypothetical protein